MADESGDTAEQTTMRRARLREVAMVFTRLGFTAFGGPAAHVALMEDEFVHRRKWLDRRHFLDLLSAVNFIPGPNSTELAIHIGLIRAGFAGLVTAGICFIAPAVLIILPIAYVYVKFGAMPQVQPAMKGVSIAVAAIVIVATWRLLKSHRRDAWSISLVVLSTTVWFLFRHLHVPQPDLLVLLMAGIAGASRQWFRKHTHLRCFAFAPLALFSIEETRGLIHTVLFFLKIGITLFGSGYVLVTYLQTGLVDQKHWLTQQQMLDAIAVGQFTPGPLLTTATFIGYLLGSTRFGNSSVEGAIFAVAATTAIFLPAFGLIAVLAGTLQRLRRAPIARATIDSLNGAVIGLLAGTAIQLLVQNGIGNGGRVSTLRVAVLLSSVALLWQGVSATWVICAALAAGWLLSL